MLHHNCPTNEMVATIEAFVDKMSPSAFIDFSANRKGVTFEILLHLEDGKDEPEHPWPEDATDKTSDFIEEVLEDSWGGIWRCWKIEVLEQHLWWNNPVIGYSLSFRQD